MIKKSLCVTGIWLLLTGCSTTQQTQPVMPTDNTVKNTDYTLAEAAASVSHSLVELAAIEQAAHPVAKPDPGPNPASYGMDATASVDWSGPIEPLIKHLAEITGYRMRVMGTAPAIPVLVTLSEQSALVADIVRDAAYQCGKRAQIIIYPQTKVIEIRYAH